MDRKPATYTELAVLKRDEDERAAFTRAQTAVARTPGALGAIDGAIAYGLNWTELYEARTTVAELIEADRAWDEIVAKDAMGEATTDQIQSAAARRRAALIHVGAAR